EEGEVLEQGKALVGERGFELEMLQLSEACNRRQFGIGELRSVGQREAVQRRDAFDRRNAFRRLKAFAELQVFERELQDPGQRLRRGFGRAELEAFELRELREVRRAGVGELGVG